MQEVLPLRKITLKEAAKITGYAPDYIGFLIRNGELWGKKIRKNIAWLAPTKEIKKYFKKNKNLATRDSSFLLKKKYLTLKEAAKLTGYAPDYIGFLLRSGKIPGKKIQTRSSWVTTVSDINKYQNLQLKNKKNFWSKYFIFLNRFLNNFNFEIPKFAVILTTICLIIFGGIFVFAFSTRNQIQTVEIYSIKMQGDWQNIENANGAPDVSETGELNSFSEANSAIYKTGVKNIVFEDFSQTNNMADIAEITETTEIAEIAGNLIEVDGTTTEITEIEEIGGNSLTEIMDIEEIMDTTEIAEIDGNLMEIAGTSTTEETTEIAEITDIADINGTTTETTEITDTTEIMEIGSPEVVSETVPEVVPEIVPEAVPEALPEVVPIENTSFLNKVKKFFGVGIANAEPVPSFTELTQKELAGAKIKFSFALGEKEPDIQIEQENSSLENNSENSTDTTSFWQKIKNLFTGFVKRIAQITRKIFARINFVANAEEEISDTEDITEIIETTDIMETTEIDGNSSTEIMDIEEITDIADIMEINGTTETAEIAGNLIEVDGTSTDITEIGGTTTEINEATNVLPSENLVNPDAKIIIWYSLNGIDWQMLDTIYNYPSSNALNDGYFSYDAPFLKNWDDIKNLKIKFEGVVGGQTQFTAYLDSVWVEASYQEKSETEGDDKEYELRPIKKDWRADEVPEFEVLPKNQKEEKNIFENLVAGVSEIFKKDPEVSAKLFNPEKKPRQLFKGETFNYETHSPTKIKIFKPEDFKPGVYNLEIEYEKDGKIYNLEQDFSWGVLAINMNKSIYLPNEESYLQMAVLDETGKSLCDAELTLEIISPSGNKKIFTTPVVDITEIKEINGSSMEIAGTSTTEETTEITETDSNLLEVSETTTEESGTGEMVKEGGILEEIMANEEIEGQTINEKITNIIKNNSLLEKLQDADTTDIGGNLVEVDGTNTEDTMEIMDIADINETTTEITDTTEIMDIEETTEITETAEITEIGSPEVVSEIVPEELPEALPETIPEALPEAVPEVVVPEVAPEENNITSFLKNIFGNNVAFADKLPEIGVIEKSSKCSPNSITNIPDYFAYYKTGEIGEYKITLTAKTKNGTYTITDSFEVKDSVPFDVERIGPTRIYPQADYEMNFKILANQDFQGKIIETAPLSFEIEKSNDYMLDITPNEKLIIWDANFISGETYKLKYAFKAPEISPYMYLLGPLSFKENKGEENLLEKIKDAITNLFANTSSSEGFIFSEARPWQIAADADVTVKVVFFKTGTTSWTVPYDWSSSNTVEVIGGGGGGFTGSNGAGGGGGGAYAKVSNITLTGGNSVGMSISATTAAASNGSDTYFCSSTAACAAIGNSSVKVGAKGGSAGAQLTGGAGGTTTSSVGDTKTVGGVGGASNANDPCGGGGGAGGPHGVGAAGGAGHTSGTYGSGGGGGGGGGGSDGISGTVDTPWGARGGNNWAGSGGAATSTGIGNPGSDGGGGGGGVDNYGGGTGGYGTEWTQTSDSKIAGSGGGGGGAGDPTSDVGGFGGGYGGGGGGGSTGGSGAQGVIVVSYTPVILDLKHYRWRDDSAALDTSGGFAAEEDNSTTTLVGTTLRLRIEIANTSNGTGTENIYKIEYAEKTGDCTTETYTEVPKTATAQYFELATSTKYASRSTVQTSLLTSDGRTFATGTGSALAIPNSTTSPFTLGNLKYTEFEYALVPTSTITSQKTFCFRLTNNGTTTGMAYTIYPQVTVHIPVATITQRAYVFQNDDGTTISSDSTSTAPNTSFAVKKGERLIARFQVDNTGDLAGTKTYKVQYDHGNNDWTDLAFGGPPSLNSGANLKEWNATTVASGGNVGAGTSIAIGKDGYPMISYFDDTNDDLLFARCTGGNCTQASDWTTTTVATAGTIGSSNSIAVGNDGYPVISYYDGGSADLLFAKCTTQNCTSSDSWTTTTVQTAGSVGWNSSIAIGNDGYPVISYVDTTVPGSYDLIFAKCDTGNCTSSSAWDTTTVHAVGDVGSSNSIAVGNDGYPVISYYDTTNYDLLFARCDTNNCTSSSNWDTATVQTAGSAGGYNSLAIGADGYPAISYNLAGAAMDLLFAKCTTQNCTSSSNWTTTTIESTYTIGAYNSLAIGTDGLPIISYNASTSEGKGVLKIAKCGNSSCTFGNTLYVVDNSSNEVGLNTSIAISPDGWPIVSYFDSTNQDLRVAKMLPNYELQPSWGLSGTSTTALTSSSTGACTENTSWQDGEWYEGTATSSSITLSVSKCTELAFAIDTSEATASTTYRLRLVSSDGTALDGYSQYPTLTVVPETSNTKRYSKDAVLTLAASCSATSSFDCNTVNTTTAQTYNGQYPAIAIGFDGLPVIASTNDANGDLIVCKCNDPGCTGGDELCSVVDTGTDWDPSIAIGSDGFPVISFVRTYTLYVCKCNDPACTGGDETCSSISTTRGQADDTSIAIRQDGNPIISFRDGNQNDFPTNTTTLAVCSCSDTSCSGTKTCTTLDNTVKDANNDSAGSGSSIKIGTNGIPMISYSANIDFENSIKVCKCANTSCTSAICGSVYTGGDTETSMAISAEGLPVISFQGGVCKCKTQTCTAATCSVISSSHYNSIAIGYDNNPVISSCSDSINNLRICNCTNATCTVASCGTIDSLSDENNNSNCPIAIGADGNPIIAYYDYTNAYLRIAKGLGLPQTAISYFNNYLKTDNQIKLTRTQWASPATTSAMFLEANPAAEDGLTYWFDNSDYTNISTTTDSSASSSITSAGGSTATSSPIFVFTDNHAANTNSLYSRWIGQSNVGASSNKIYLQIFRFGNSSSTTLWETVASSSACTANTDCTIDGTVTANLSDYYFPEYKFNDSAGTTTAEFWTFWRVYQDGGAENLKTDYWGIQYDAFPAPPSAGITVSGVIYTEEGTGAYDCSGNNLTVNLKVNGGETIYSGTCEDADGSYNISEVLVGAVGDVLTVYLDGETEKANAITRASSTDYNISDLDLYQNRIIVRHEDSTPLNISDLDYYDSGQDADILFLASSTAGTLTASDTSEFFVRSGSTFLFYSTSTAGTINLHDFDNNGTITASTTKDISVSGIWDNDGIFNAASSTVTFTSTLATTTIKTGGSSFYNLTFNGSNGVWTFQDDATTTNDLTVTAGTASSTYNMYVYGGDVLGNGTLNWLGGTFMVDGSGYFGGTSEWTFYDLTFGDGSISTAITATSTGTTTITDVLTVSTSQTLNAGEKSWVLSGSGTPFVLDGGFGPATSTFYYTATANTNIKSTLYYNLNLSPSGAGTPTYTLSIISLTCNNNLTIGDGTNEVIVNIDTNDPSLDINGNFTLSANATTVASNLRTLSVAGNWTNSGNFDANSGTTTFDATVPRTITTGGSPFYNLYFNGSGGGWWTFQDDATTTNDLTVTQGAVVISHYDMNVLGGDVTGDGTLTWLDGTFMVDGTGEFGGATDWTFYDLTFGDGSGPQATTTAINTATTTISNYLTIAANQGLDAGFRDWIIAGACAGTAPYTPFPISGSFNASSSTFKYTSWGDTNITATTYYNLELGVGDLNLTYNLGTTTGQTIVVNNEFVIGDSVNPFTASANLYNPIIDVNGSTTITASAVFVASTSAITVAGNWENSGTFTAASSTVTFDGTAAGQKITSGGSAFYNLTFNGSGGAWAFQDDASTSNNFTITNGAVTAPTILSVGGNWSVTLPGAFTHNSGEIIFIATNSGHTISDGGSPFYKINFNGTGGEWLYSDGTSTAPSTTTVQAGTPTFLNAKTGGVSVTGGTLYVDWYLGIHAVDANDTDVNIENATCTVSEVSGSSTIWSYNAGSWGDATDSAVATTSSGGKTPQPTSAGAIRIREYKRTSSATTTYNYNLTVAVLGFSDYDYYLDQGNKYLTSTSSLEAQDNTIYVGWHRQTNSSMNGSPPYSGLDAPPEMGSWYVGLTSDLQFEISTDQIDLTLNQGNDFTATSFITLLATTSYPTGFTITADMRDTEGKLSSTTESVYIQRFAYNNISPVAWDENCNASSTRCGFGYNTDDLSLAGSDTNYDRYASTTFCGSDLCWSGFATTIEAVDTVADTSSGGGQNNTIILKASVASTQQADVYEGTIYLTCTANY
ncbi:MAG: hypothetical protein PHF44_00745 [Candidatus Pacebacteria bacterium]|nr:hypothetical protein [Candidatus Paceibacterota bacterium]